MTLDYDGLNYGQGWLPNVAAVEVPRLIEADHLQPVGSFIRPRQQSTHVDLTRYLAKLYGPQWYLNQQDCGSCVAFGASLSCDILMAIDIVENRKQAPQGRTDPMTIYWGSRVEVGGGRVIGQGSIGVWAAKWLKQWGGLEQRKYPSADLTKYSPSVCCGPNARRGVPDDLEPIARNYPVKSYAQVRTFEEAVAAVDSGYPVTIASNQGFRMTLDSQGFATPSGTWNHQMAIVGYDLEPVECCWVANSWGPCYTGGPAGWNPAVKKVRKATINRMLSQGDSWAFSDFVSWAPKSIDFARLNF